MTLVRIVKNWTYPDLMRQTPEGRGVWQGIHFTLDDVEACDALVVLNYTSRPIKVKCPPENVWAVVQEPPVPEYRWLEKGFRVFARVYTPDVTVADPRYVHSHGALPWHVNKTYDFLKTARPPEKSRLLSSVTSRETNTTGRKKRVIFLEWLREQMEMDVWGRGFVPLEDKWDGLAPYCYSLALENYSGPHYWTEKLADCFLAWTMPIYYGAINITEYFPSEALVQIDINRPEEAWETIQDTIHSDRWRKNLDAIAYARQLILEKYQFFPFVHSLLVESPAATQHRLVKIPANLPPRLRKNSRLQQVLRHFINSLTFK